MIPFFVTGIEKMISLFAMLGLCFLLALVMFNLEYIIYYAYDKSKNKRKSRKRKEREMMERFRRMNEEIWKANIGPLEISRRLRFLANDLELSRIKSEYANNLFK